MDEHLHNIDKLFKTALERSDDLPSDKVWESIDKNLDKKKVVFISEKYKRLKWVAAALLIFSVGMAMYAIHTRIKNREIVKQNKIKDKKPFSNNNSSVKEINDNKTTKPSIAQHQGNKTIAGKKVKAGQPGSDRTTDTRKEALNNVVAKNKSRKEVDQQTESNIVKGDNKRTTAPKQLTKRGVEKMVNRKPRKDQLAEAGAIAKRADAPSSNANPTKTLKNDLEEDASGYKRLYGEVVRLNDEKKALQTPPSNKLLNDALSNHSIKKISSYENSSNSSANKIKLPALKTPSFSASLYYSPDFISMRVQHDKPRFGKTTGTK
jgi:hypothetical protein